MKVELHLHTNRYSPCAGNSPQDMMVALITAGYDTVFITEHEVVWPDKELASLGKSDLAVPDYRRKVQKLLSVLDAIRDDLKEIADVSKPYPRELLLDVKWAEVDIKKIKEMRDVLIGELDVRR